MTREERLLDRIDAEEMDVETEMARLAGRVIALAGAAHASIRVTPETCRHVQPIFDAAIRYLRERGERQAAARAHAGALKARNMARIEANIAAEAAAPISHDCLTTTGDL